MFDNYILNEGSEYQRRLVACCADLGEPCHLEVVEAGRLLLATDKGKYFLSHGFEPAWDCLGFVSVELEGKLQGKWASYFNPRVTAALLGAGLLCACGVEHPDWTPGRTLSLPNEVCAWNVIGRKTASDLWAIVIVSGELTWIDTEGAPLLASSEFDMNAGVMFGIRGNDRIAEQDNLLWRLIMTLGLNEEECSCADSRVCLAARNKIFLAARYAHNQRLMAWHAARNGNGKKMNHGR